MTIEEQAKLAIEQITRSAMALKDGAIVRIELQIAQIKWDKVVLEARLEALQNVLTEVEKEAVKEELKK